MKTIKYLLITLWATVGLLSVFDLIHYDAVLNILTTLCTVSCIYKFFELKFNSRKKESTIYLVLTIIILFFSAIRYL